MKSILFITILTFHTIILLSCSEKSKDTTVKIGAQVWATEDARVRTYRNGDSILFCGNIGDWNKASSEELGACCYARFDSVKGRDYGLIYNFYAVNDSRGFAPKGYKVPSADDWQRLINYAGGTNVAGRNLKANDGSWYPSDTFLCFNKYGFKAKHFLTVHDKAGTSWGKIGKWWTSDTMEQKYYATYVAMSYATDKCTVSPYGSKGNGMSVRFLRE